MLLPLEDVASHFKNLGYKVKTTCNDNGVLGDKQLVTGIKIDKDCVDIVYANFIFNILESK